MPSNPFRRLSEAVTLATMRPPIAPKWLLYQPGRTDIDLAGKRVLLTGASSGIGEAAAEQFAHRGAIVAVVARRADNLNAVVDRITAAGGTARAFPCDMSDLDAVDAMAAAVEAELGGVDILVNNAGRSIRRPLEESLERWHDLERTMQLNYYAPLRLIRAISPGMLARGDGHIINVSTWGVLVESTPLFAPYNASKAALTTVSRIIESEWAERGVHSTTLFYPLVKTDMPAATFDNHVGLSSAEAAEWMVVAARTRPIRIAPRVALTAKAFDVVNPAWVDTLMRFRPE